MHIDLGPRIHIMTIDIPCYTACVNIGYSTLESEFSKELPKHLKDPHVLTSQQVGFSEQGITYISNQSWVKLKPDHFLLHKFQVPAPENHPLWFCILVLSIAKPSYWHICQACTCIQWLMLSHRFRPHQPGKPVVAWSGWMFLPLNSCLHDSTGLGHYQSGIHT